jgi:hypothetical protein
MFKLIHGTIRVSGIAESLAHYHINEQGLPADNPKYYGYTDKDENWYIQRMNRTTGTARYASGSGSFSTAYANKESQIYNYFHVEF